MKKAIKERNFKKSESLWQKASQLEDDGKISEAIKLYTISAKLGNSIAQSNLGNLLDDMVRPPKPKEAVYWYKRSVQSGYYIAARNLAVHYKNQNNRRWYLYWLSVAAKLGDEEARWLLKKGNAKRKKS